MIKYIEPRYHTSSSITGPRIERDECKITLLESGHERIHKSKRTYEIWDHEGIKYFIIPRHDPWIEEDIVTMWQFRDDLIAYSQKSDNNLIEVYEISPEYIVTEYLEDYLPMLIKSANDMYDADTVDFAKEKYHEVFKEFDTAYSFYANVIHDLKDLNENTGIYFEDICPNNIMINYKTLDYKLIDIGALRVGKFKVDFPFTQLIYGDGANDMKFVDVIDIHLGWRNAPECGIPITNCISTHNNLNYLKLAVESLRKNSFFKNSPLIIHAENCTDGTNEWLNENSEKYNIQSYIDVHSNTPKGIGGGANYVADKVETEYINFIHADFYVGKDFDWQLLINDLIHDRKQMTFSYRIQPDIFNEAKGQYPNSNRPGTIIVEKNQFGELYNNFDESWFNAWIELFKKENKNIEVRKAEGVSGLIKKKYWDEIGGNDKLFAPASWEDYDLFLRMDLEGIEFVCITDSVVYHFAARSSHFPDDDFTKSSERQKESEKANIIKWYSKWKMNPTFDKNQMIKADPFRKRYEELKVKNRHINF